MSVQIDLVSIFLVLSTLMPTILANLRCYSCAPCNELEWYAGSTAHFESDCYIDRYCMKISGTTTDIFGYRREVSIRGCPWVSLLTRPEEGCTGTAMDVAGLGRVEGKICYCGTHLCNGATRTSTTTTTSMVISLSVVLTLYLILR